MKKTTKQITRKSEKVPAEASNLKRSRARLLTVKEEWILYAALVLFLLTSLFIVGDYGMNIDSQKNFQEGEMHLNYLLTGQVDQGILQWQLHGAYIFMLADVAKRMLHDTLQLYDPVAARYIILPFLSAFFLIGLFYFVKRHGNALQALIAVGFLLSFPYFWGYSFSNLKDIPLLIFFSLSLMSFVEWDLMRKRRYLYGFFLLWGLALAIKVYAFLVPVLLLLWLLIRPRQEAPSNPVPWPRLVFYLLSGLCLTVLIVLLLYAPAFWGVEDKWTWFQLWRDQVKSITGGQQGSFSLQPFIQVFFRTPLLLLILAVTGLIRALREYRKNPLNSLLLLWLILPLWMLCLPGTLTYHNGMRHFMVFLVPFGLLATMGFNAGADLLANKMKVNRKKLLQGGAVVVVFVNLWGIVSTHPYQTTFFNALAGGLQGAQEKKITDACDYWLTSYREAGRWIDLHGVPNAHVLVVYRSATPDFFNTGLLKDAVHRPDLKPLRLPTIPVADGKIIIPRNTYLILVPYDYQAEGRAVLEETGLFKKVHEIRRQGGEICTIYYTSG